MRQIGLDRLLYGSDGPEWGGQTPAAHWADLQAKIPLTPEEFNVIAGNVAPGGVAAAQGKLTAIGYACPITGELCSETRAVLRAVQRHWRPEKIDGELDGETDALIGALFTMTAA